MDHLESHEAEKSAPPPQIDHKQLDGKTLRDALSASCAWLEQHIDVINSLNVFPVPDGDTGTNMFLTMQAALRETNELTQVSIAEVTKAISHGALMGARGNSGVILSQILRGIAKVLAEQTTLEAKSLALALKEGAKTAYQGVIKPVEGTILTVAREAADVAMASAQQDQDLIHVLEMTVKEARASVARTPSLLPELQAAGVVDSGGQGYLVLLEGMLYYLRGDQTQLATPSATQMAQPTMGAQTEYGYEALFILSGQDLPVNQIRAHIMSMGDSVLVVGDEHVLKVHVHTGRPGAVIDYAIGMGNIQDVVIENLQEQTETFAAPAALPSQLPTESLADIAVVAVVSGEGLQEVFRSLGASAIVDGGQTTNPSTEELLEAINNIQANSVILLPNNSNVIMASEQAKQLASKDVRVIITKTVPQGISALLSFNYQADLDANATIMQEAVEQIQTAEITTAVRSAQVNGLSVQEGQAIGLLNGDLVSAGETELEVIDNLLAQMDVADYDIVTIYYGDTATQPDAEVIAEHIQDLYPGPEVEIVNGGQPHYHYVISAE